MIINLLMLSIQVFVKPQTNPNVIFQSYYAHIKFLTEYNESTAGADASVEALKLYDMKLTLAYSSLLALLALVACSVQKREMINRDRC